MAGPGEVLFEKYEEHTFGPVRLVTRPSVDSGGPELHIVTEMDIRLQQELRNKAYQHVRAAATSADVIEAIPLFVPRPATNSSPSSLDVHCVTLVLHANGKVVATWVIHNKYTTAGWVPWDLFVDDAAKSLAQSLRMLVGGN